MKSFLRAILRGLKYLMGRMLMPFCRIKPSVIVMVDGGLGSTIWKYCVGKAIEKHSGAKVKYDLSWFASHGKDMNGVHSRNFDLLRVFPDLEFTVASDREIAFYRRFFYYSNAFPYKYNDVISSSKAPLYVDGYFENWKYLDYVTPEMRDWFDFTHVEIDDRNRAVLNDITGHEASVCVHVRRGDYVNTGLDILDLRYYLSAIDLIIEKVSPVKPKFFFFSNDPDWVESQIMAKMDASLDRVLVNNNGNDSGFVDLMLISKGKHQIAANSSFGFLGGYLNRNPEKLVVIPDVWLANSEGNPVLEGSESAHRVPGFIVLDHKGRK